MRGAYCVAAVVATVSLSSVLASSAARAEDADPVEAVKKALATVNGYVHDGLPTAAQAALPEAEKLFAALDDFHKEKVAKELETQRDRLKAWLASRDGNQVKAYVTRSVENAELSVSRNIGDGRNVYAEYNEAVKLFDDQISDEMNKKLLDADTVAQLQKKLNGIKVEFKKARIREAVNSWENDEKQVKREHQGWEEDTKPYEISRVCVGWEMGCERTVRFMDRIDRWLESWKVTLDANPDDPTLKKLCADLETQRTAAQAKISEFRKAVFAEAEKLPPGEQRDTMTSLYRAFLKAGADEGASPKKGQRRKSAGAGPVPGDADLIPKITALLERWDGEKSKGKSDKEALIKELIAGSDASWPGLLKGFSLVKLETSEVLKDPAKWKGKTGKIVGVDLSGSAYEAQQYFIIEVDGVPVCGGLDSGLAASWNAFTAFAEKNALKLGATQEYVGTVEGTCKVWQRVKRGDKIVRGDQIDGVKVRIVALKTERFAGAAGHASSLDSVSTGSVAGSAGGGTGHILHRLVAWAMCGLLALCGALAVAVGASPFVPAIQEQRAKLGSYLGYAGLAFAGIGVVWFGAAMLFWIVEGDGGSLPSVALILAGAFTGLVVLRSKGEIKPAPTAEGAAPVPTPASPDMLTTIQPLGVVLGLGCFGAAAIHFLLWDWLLL